MQTLPSLGPQMGLCHCLANRRLRSGCCVVTLHSNCRVDPGKHIALQAALSRLLADHLQLGLLPGLHLVDCDSDTEGIGAGIQTASLLSRPWIPNQAVLDTPNKELSK